MDKFWQGIVHHYEEFVQKNNSINKINDKPSRLCRITSSFIAAEVIEILQNCNNKPTILWWGSGWPTHGLLLCKDERFMPPNHTQTRRVSLLILPSTWSHIKVWNWDTEWWVKEASIKNLNSIIAKGELTDSHNKTAREKKAAFSFIHQGKYTWLDERWPNAWCYKLCHWSTAEKAI